MLSSTLRHLVILSLSLLSFSAYTSVAEPPLTDLLRQALYAEEVSRDPAAAAAQYEQILTRFKDQQAIAATALFRLAEVRRLQGKKDEAIPLYQQLLTDFPKAEAEGKLARQHLTEMGGKIPEAGMAVVDEGAKELARLTQLHETSPDVFRNQDLAEAVGKPRVLRYMLDSGVSARRHPDSERSPLEEAARLGNLESVKLLLEKVKDQVAGDLGPGLAAALDEGNLEIARSLLAAGADPNWQSADAQKLGLRKAGYGPAGLPTMDASSGRPGTPLAQAVRDAKHADGSDEAIALLLEAKANVNLAALETGLTPLHFAVVDRRPGSIDLVKRLLAAGANRDAVSTRFWWCESPARGFEPVTPLTLAIKIGNWEAAKLMLTSGPKVDPTELWASSVNAGLNDSLGRAWFKPRAEILQFLIAEKFDPNLLTDEHSTALEFAVQTGSVELTKLLLAHGADPNRTRHPHAAAPLPGEADPIAVPTDEMKQNPTAKPLLAQVRRDDPKVLLEITRLLLDAGSTPDAHFNDVLATIAKHDAPGELVRKLLAQRPAGVNLKQLPKEMDQWQAVPRRIYLDEVVLPALAKEPGLPLLNSTTGNWQALVDPTADKPLPATAEFLLEHLKELLPGGQKRTEATGRGGILTEWDGIVWPALTRVRRDADGKVTRSGFDLTGEGALPDIQPGDILELGSAGEAVRENSTERTALEAKLVCHLRKRVAFPVRIERDGKTTEIQLRGGLLVFDPTTNEAPLMAAGPLVWLYVNDGTLDYTNNYLDIGVKREGWSELKLRLGSTEASGFQLQSGDHLILPPARDLLARRDQDRSSVRLVIPGLPFTRTFSSAFMASPNGGPIQADESLLPTLVQVIADVYAGWPGLAADSLPKDDGDRFVSLAASPTPVIPGHPDFSKIRIRRLGSDDGESVIEVDLTDAIHSTTDATLPADARRSDVMLRAGDIVELPLAQDQSGQQWTGFSPAEARFFHQALSGNILVTRSTGKIEQLAINYQSPAWRATVHGLLPLPPSQGTSSLRTNHVVPGAYSLRRGDRVAHFISPNAGFILRDGDQVSVQTLSNGLPNRGPRPRVVPPPAAPTSTRATNR